MDDVILQTHDDMARDILRSNDRGGHTIPTSGLYPYQWNWDSVFVSLGLAEFDMSRAWRELATLFEAQWPDGMVPHIVFREDNPSYFPGPPVWQADNGPLPSSGITQPPVAASAILDLAKREPERARPYVRKLDAWHRWFHDARDPDGLGVIAITHPWESGRDNLPDWDVPGAAINIAGVGDYTRRDTDIVVPDMRPGKEDYDRYLALVRFGAERKWSQKAISAESPFFVADPGTTAILLRAERDLASLGRLLGEPVFGVEERITRLESGFDRFWNSEVENYCAYDLRTGKHAEEATSAGFLALYAGVTKKKGELVGQLEKFDRSVEFMVPSFAPHSPLFNHRRYWRGPVWAHMNFMIARGLSDVGEVAWANRLRSDTATLIRNAGFAEYFSPLSGEGCGGGNFSWTSAIWLAWKLGDVEGLDKWAK